MEDHVPRHAQMGAWVLINDRWYYLIRDRYGRPGKGNDKGGVEGLVGYARRNFMVPPLMHVNMHCRAVGAAVPVVGRVQPLSRRAMPQATGGDFARSR